MRKLQKLLALASTGAVALSLLVAGATPSAAAETITADDKASAAALDMTMSEYKSIQKLAKKGQVELWANGKKFVPSNSPSPLLDNGLPLGKIAAYQAKTWGACGVNTANNKHVRTWYVNTVPFRYEPAVLQCGTWTSKEPTKGWGFRHIKGRHGAEWQQMANQIQMNSNWRDVADFAINDGLRNIYSGQTRPQNNTYRFFGKVELKRYDGKSLKVYYTTVAVDQTDHRIITAYYRNRR